MSILSSLSRRKFIFSCLASTVLSKAMASTSMHDNFAPFSFVYISDCHLTTGLTDNFMLLQESQLFLQDAIKQINLLKPDFVIFGGDQVQGLGNNDTNWQLFLDVLQTLDSSWYFVLGESDVSGGYEPVNKMRSYGRDWKGRGLSNDAPYWSYEPAKGIRLIGLDTSQANTMTGNIAADQLEWLQQVLGKDSNAFTIIVSHHPLLAPPGFDINNPYLLPQAEAVRTILEKSGNQCLSLNGHIHCNKIQSKNNIWYISSAGLDVYPCSFRFFKVMPEHIEIESYQVKFLALIKKAKHNLLNSSLADSLYAGHPENFVRLVLGGHQDQNTSLPRGQ